MVGNQITGNLYLGCSAGSKSRSQSYYIAEHLLLKVQIYENGILRVNIDEKLVNPQRFKLTDYDLGASHVEEQLISIGNLQDYSVREDEKIFISYNSKDKLDTYQYTIQFSPFRIEQRINDITTIIVNDKDTLMFESFEELLKLDTTKDKINEDCLAYLKSEVDNQTLEYLFGLNQRIYLGDGNSMLLENSMVKQIRQTQTSNYLKREGFVIGFKVFSKDLFGLPERSSQFLLENTDDQEPYRFSLPYITGHSKDHDESIMLYNAAETWIDILELDETDSSKNKYINVITESGQLEFFLIGSASKDRIHTPPKRVSNLLATIAGYPNLPPRFSIGFHYSKWEKETSAYRLVEYNQKFENAGIPVDVLWLDIPHTNGNRYFTFNPFTFSQQDLHKAVQSLNSKGRKIVVITDPHIKVDRDYSIYKDGLQIERDNNICKNDKIANIFIKDPQHYNFRGDCWPGQSSWIDYFNPTAQEYWSSLYDYSKFKGTTSMFHIWNDMNEPSVFNTEETVMPKQNLHVLGDGRIVPHRDTHNAYGLLMTKATYQGLLDRDDSMLRPFILTRSSFFGTQKYAAKWTGDNRANQAEVGVSLNQLLSLGISGMPFVGSDVPGFAGNPSQELFIMYYQIAAWYPFFRESDKRCHKYKIQPHSIFDEKLIETEDSFMIGEDFVIFPKLQSLQSGMSIGYFASQTLPQGNIWYDYETKEITEGDSKQKDIILDDNQRGAYVRGGSIIPIKLHGRSQSLTLAEDKPLRLDLYLDKNNEAQGKLYLDDGISFRYKKNDQFVLIHFRFENDVLTFKLDNSATDITDKFKCLKIKEINLYSKYIRYISFDVVADGVSLDYLIQDQIVKVKSKILQQNKVYINQQQQSDEVELDHQIFQEPSQQWKQITSNPNSDSAYNDSQEQTEEKINLAFELKNLNLKIADMIKLQRYDEDEYVKLLEFKRCVSYVE
ncbi:alpha glucosidase ii [Stylonychia lemnae]|uniref:Alpha glucosidase ii n=1 Tax=Stylonychia lemnae TaxID=5949 RepID=A0A078B170_STYLE|nr:alpha glucosidase ii [Stylonychia lemnae]|eukprot:CDW88355.1 alpha glucosidase ii [Stylonychia lemnae]